tara:strand:+ start:175 stop:840 length:666 start_codon:yes stop_codon:yes gene_type:complete
MKAFLLAAGKGKRLLPFTNENPKPLLKVGGMSLIERNVLKLKQSNVDEVVINIHHLGEKIIDHLGDGSRYDIKITYSIEEKLLGTGGGILHSIHHFDNPFLVLSSDTWTDFDFKTLALKKNILGHMVLIDNPEHNPDGDVALVDGIIRPETEERKYTFSGLAMLSPKLFIQTEVKDFGLWDDILKPASLNNFISGELYKGRFENLNTLDDVERLDGLMGEE